MTEKQTPIGSDKYSMHGAIDVIPLTKIQKMTGDYLTRNWSAIPHVTHNDEADIGVVESARVAISANQSERRLTNLAFLVKAVVLTLKKHPIFNSSLDDSGYFVIQKSYFNIGVAMDTPRGLVVAVVRDADRLSVVDIALQIATLSAKAREKGLTMKEMSGGCFTISSLGKSGGTSFTPIINAAEVAILGVSRAADKPKQAANGSLLWIKSLPLSLSYDHRVINGMQAAHFMSSLIAVIQDEKVDWMQAS